MKKPQLIIFLACILILACYNIPKVNATGNGSSGGGGTGSGGGGSCEAYDHKFHVCQANNQFMAVKLRLMYYNETSNTMSKVGGTKNYYIIRETSTEWAGNFKKQYQGDYEKKSGWFTYTSTPTFKYNSDKIFESIIKQKNNYVYDDSTIKQLNEWLEKLSSNKRNKVQVETLANAIKNDTKSCGIHSAAAEGTCYKQSGYRIIIEPVISVKTPKKPSNDMKNAYKNIKKEDMPKGSNVFLTIKELARIAGTRDAVSDVNTSDNWWKAIGKALHTDFNDIGVKTRKLGLGAKETFQCLKNTQWTSENAECGYGYNIIDISGVITPDIYKCENIPNTDKCQINKYTNNAISSDSPVVVKFGNSSAKEFPCQGQTSFIGADNQTYALTEKCPNITYRCAETGTYGKCRIDKYINNKYVGVLVDNIDCNNDTKSDGRTSYNGHNLENGYYCPFKPKYNYDVDVACENCTGNNNNGSYQIQDTSDWEAILHTQYRNDNANIQNRFKKANSGAYCRDEFKIIFPNANTVTNQIYSVSGTYITVNNPGGKFANDTYNFEPLKVIRTKQCISSNTNQIETDMDMGKIYLKYDDKKYGHNFELKSDATRVSTSTTNEQINISPRQTKSGLTASNYNLQTKIQTAYFKLEDDIYRWIAESKITIGETTYENGTSILRKPANTEHFRDTGTANLPISFTNKDGINIYLTYQLPEDATGLVKAINEGKIDYLDENGATEKDVYNNGPNLAAPNNQFAGSSACAKMYGFNTNNYNKCKENRNQKANECLQGLSTNTKKEQYKYQCSINNCSTEEEAKKNNVAWNAKGNYCCPAGTTYDKTTGECKGDNHCRKENNKCYNDANIEIDCNGDEWKKNCTCQTIEGGYLDKNGDIIYDHKQFDDQCCVVEGNYDLETLAAECPHNREMGLSVCYRCPYTGLCPMPGNVCPSPSGRDIIYRPIDLNNPFPGQSGKENGRDTGSNWCELSEDRVLHCSGKPSTNNRLSNLVVYDEIINNRKSKGYDIYNQKPLYEIELDANAIKAIKKDNQQSNYDDWTDIKYIKEYDVTTSEFIKKTWGTSKFSGVCVDGNPNKKTCAEVSLRDE